MKALKLGNLEEIQFTDVLQKELGDRGDETRFAYVPCDEDGICFLVYDEDDWKVLARACRGFEQHPGWGAAAKLLADRIEHDAG